MSEYKVDVQIDGKNYTLVTNEAKENIKEIVEIFDRKIQEVKSSRLTFDRQLILAGVNITDDLFKLAKDYNTLKEESKEPLSLYPKVKEEVEKLRDENEFLLEEKSTSKEKINNLQEEILSLKNKLDKHKNSDDTIEKLKNEVKRLQVHVMDLTKENDTLKGNL
ncbi:cell division protein ZapA [uncultured Anaerococcus sp.]|uniref:cell division protein ZapA n=1 Tax=uncultured Anaerococcus sp. TaxID=293428 RepID=UPI00288A50C4|nr:cell division protein ZapA [uncultured Anaerococcus sp.]